MIQRARYEPLVQHLFAGARITGCAPLTGGVSATVVRLDLALADQSPLSVVVREHAAEQSGLDASKEAALLRELHRRGLPVPALLDLDVQGRFLGQPLVVMAYVEGTTAVPVDLHRAIDVMAALLLRVHQVDTPGLPELPERLDPLLELFQFLPEGSEWQRLQLVLSGLADTRYRGKPVLLHGDYWPENLLWQGSEIVALLDWEDAAVGDPLSDLACAALELRYRYGVSGMEACIAAYKRHRPCEPQRLALWQAYVAAAALKYMGDWGLPAELLARMRQEALATLQEAAQQLGA